MQAAFFIYMANSYFRFKQFTVEQDKCAMKVGTDGVLLGAWASVEGVRHILDVGTGTGLIALMVAQRSEALIDGIDIDENASRQAEMNCDASPFAGRIRIQRIPFHAFCQSSNKLYDRIISNPPYFHHSLKSPNAERSMARHTDSLLLEDLINGSRQLLTPEGRLCLILPSDQEERLKQLTATNGLYLARQINVTPLPGTSPKRMLVEIALTPQRDFQPENLTIELTRHSYTPEYIRLTQDFYLNM